MTPVPATTQARRRAIRLWLLAVAGLMVVTLLVGGATRLTESGLSIVEWKPVTGIVPPLDAAAWQAEFDKYQAIPQYRELNHGMSLDEFKTIYWWEWTHRLLARVVGAAFLLPFLWFLWQGSVEPGSAPPVVDDIRIGRSARRRRLVDGLVGTGRPGERVAVSPRVPPDAGLRHIRRHPVDGAGTAAACAAGGTAASAEKRVSHSHSRSVPDLSRCARRRHGRRLGLQHLAADRRHAGAQCVAAVLRRAAVAEFFRERAHRAVHPPHGGLWIVDGGDRARDPRGTHGARRRAHRRAGARCCRHAAGCARHHDPAVPGADRAFAAASGHGDCRAHRLRSFTPSASRRERFPLTFPPARRCRHPRHWPAPARDRR